MLYRHWDKRVTSFITNYYKAMLTGHITDVHNMRVDMKKIMTLIALFEKFGKLEKGFRKDAHLLDELFITSGKLREAQVNIKFLEKHHPVDFGLIGYMRRLEIKQEMCLRNFYLESACFDVAKLETVSENIKKLLSGMDIDRFKTVTKKFIRRKLEKIRDLKPDLQNLICANNIRKNLKSVATVVTLLYLIQSDEEKIKFLADLNRTEKMLGAWYNKKVILASIDRYISWSEKANDTPLNSMQQMRLTVGEECDNLNSQFLRNWPL